MAEIVETPEGVFQLTVQAYPATGGGGTGTALTDAVDVPIVAGVADVASAIDAGAFTAQVTVTAETTVEIVLPDPTTTSGGWVLAWFDPTGVCAITYSGGTWGGSPGDVNISATPGEVIYLWYMTQATGISGAVWFAGPLFGADQLSAGTGDVVGPGSSTVGHIATWDDTGGTTLADGGALGDAATKNVGTSAGTVAAGDDSRITGAVQTSRTVSAGTGLTGGGDLSANRTISADFGSTSGKVTEGNDSRLSDARTPNVAGSNDDIMQRKSGVWTYRTPAQVAADLTTLAPLASPTFTGTPAAPTATTGTNTTQVATTAFVASAASLLRTPAAVVATATNTTTITPVATFTVPGGELVAGDAVRMYAMLEYFNNSGGAVTCVLRGKFGSTTILTTTTFNMSSSANKAHPWVELDLFIESTTAQRLSGRFDLNLNSSTTWPRASTTDIGSGYGVATENTATDKDLVLSVEMGSAVSGVSIGAVLATAQIIKKR